MGSKARNAEAQGKAGDVGAGVSEGVVVWDSGVSVDGIWIGPVEVSLSTTS